MTKKRKIIMTISIAVSACVVTYFALGIIGTAIATQGYINIRNCDPDLLEEDFYRIQNCRKDYF